MAAHPAFFLGELWRFLRIETCLFISGIAVFGYLINQHLGIELIYTILAVFMVSGSGYAHNHITDKEEDIVNNRRLNMFAKSRLGGLIVITMITWSGSAKR